MSPFRRRRPARPPDDAPTRVHAPSAPPGAVAREERIEEHVPARRRFWDPYWPWLLLLLLVVLAGLGALLYFSRDEDKAVVPNVVGQSEAAAVEEIENRGLDAVVRRESRDEPRGQVFATRPGAGSQLDEGEEVAVLVSRGPVRATVPNVVGLDLEEAEQRLERAGLSARVRRVFSDEPVGSVVAQSPAAGETVEADTPVRVNASKGTGRVEVPDLIGLTEDEAKEELTGAGLKANVFEVPAPEPAGTVVAQNPPPGDTVGQGDTVRLNVSDGEGGGTETEPAETEPTETTGGGGSGAASATVPGVVGQPLRRAQATLSDAGFRVLVDYVESGRPRGVVIGQSPAGGASAREGATVTLRVSSGAGASLRTVPDVVGLPGEEAAAELRGAGFDVETVQEPSPDPAEEGLVIRQAPGPGRRAPEGALVTIYVGSG